MALVVHSPSNLAQYVSCPRKYWGQRAKLIQWKETPQKLRGTAVHAALEQAVKDGPQAVKAWPDGIAHIYTQSVISDLRKQALTAQLFTEHEMCVNDKYVSTGWWDDDAMLRAKADLILLWPDHAFIGDWKTGKIYPDSDLQLRVEALLVHVLYKVPVVNWSLFYVDYSQTKSGVVDFTKGVQQVEDIVLLMQKIKTLVETGGAFLPKKNKFCKWCDLYHGMYCEDSKGW